MMGVQRLSHVDFGEAASLLDSFQICLVFMVARIQAFISVHSKCSIANCYLRDHELRE